MATIEKYSFEGDERWIRDVPDQSASEEESDHEDGYVDRQRKRMIRRGITYTVTFPNM